MAVRPVNQPSRPLLPSLRHTFALENSSKSTQRRLSIADRRAKNVDMPYARITTVGLTHLRVALNIFFVHSVSIAQRGSFAGVMVDQYTATERGRTVSSGARLRGQTLLNSGTNAVPTLFIGSVDNLDSG